MNIKENIIQEVFVPIKGFEDFHVSNLGRVKSFRALPEGKVLIHGFDERGYAQVNLTDEAGKSGSKKIHRLVWDHFGEGERMGREITVDHIDFNKSNNWISNLQLLSNRDNVIKSKRKPGKLLGAFKRGKNRWSAHICIKGVYKKLGCFGTELEAHHAYMKEYLKEKEQAA